MTLFNDLSISKKISFLIAVLLTLLVFSSIFGISKMNTIGHELKTVQAEDIPLIELVSGITVKQLEKAVLIEKAMRIQGVTVSKLSVDDINAEINRLSRAIDEEIKQGEAVISQAKSHALSMELEEELKGLDQALLAIEAEHKGYEHQVDRVLGALKSGEGVTDVQVEQLETFQKTLDDHLAELLIGVERMTEHALEKVHQDEEAGLQGMVLIGLISTLFGLLLGFVITRAITKPIAAAVDATARLANGDLTVKFDVTSKDETGQLLQAMQVMSERLLDMVSQIAAASVQLSQATHEVAQVTIQSSANIESQNTQLDQASVAMNEMSATVRDVAENASQAASSTQYVDQASKQGRKLVSEVNVAIQSLSKQIEQTKDSISRLDSETESVGGILDVITSIAEQTNLLALNAAIEAARAGEHGRGFAVVADEVRALASKTKESISTIQIMVDDLKNQAHSSVDAMSEGFNKAAVTVELSQHAENALVEVAKGVDTITDMNLQIASAAEQQSVVAEEVNSSLALINLSAKENASGAQQVSVATEEIAQLSENLKILVGQFKVA